MEELTETKSAAHVAEQALIGSILKDGSQYENLADIIQEIDFDWQAYGWCWKAFGKLHEQGLKIDTITTGDELQNQNRLNDFIIGQGTNFSGRAALSRLREIGEIGSAESYARKVLEHSAKRQQLEVFAKGAYWTQNGRNADDIKNDIFRRLEEIRTWGGESAKHTQTIGQAAAEAYQNTMKAAKGEVQCVPTELIDLDKLLSGGMYSPGFLIIAGRPGDGKSAFLATVAKNAAEKKKKIAVFSLEMANREVAQRILAMESGVPTDRQRSGKLEEGEWAKYANAIEHVDTLPIIVNDLPAISPAGIRRVLRRIGDFDLVIVDYLQLQRADEKTDKRYIEVGAVSQGLKAIAKEFDRPVIAAAQMSRAVEQRSNKRPVLSDLRESGSLEQDSDVVMFLYNDPDKQGITELIIAKHRNGPTGSVELYYRPGITKFENATTKPRY